MCYSPPGVFWILLTVLVLIVVILLVVLVLLSVAITLIGENVFFKYVHVHLKNLSLGGALIVLVCNICTYNNFSQIQDLPKSPTAMNNIIA